MPSPSLSEVFAEIRPLLPTYLHLLVSALFPIYAGTHASLSRPSSAAKSVRKESDNVAIGVDDDEDDTKQKMEGLSPRDAIILPVMAGLVLAGLYWLIVRYGADVINLLLGWYFAAVGLYSVANFVNDGASLALGYLIPTYCEHEGKLWKLDYQHRKALCLDSGGHVVEIRDPETSSILTKVQWQGRAYLKQKYTVRAYISILLDMNAVITKGSVISALIGLCAVSYANLIAKPWWLNNLQGFAVCYSAMQFMSPTSFATGTLILAGLFAYDVWAVFFTPLMVTVAKSLDQPIKLMFPQPENLSAAPGEPPVTSYSMLGLGDIVLPGIMIGLALRFDLYMFYLKKQRKVTRKSTEADGKDEIVLEKAPYVSVTGRWGDRFWTRHLPTSAKIPQLTFTFPKTYFTASMVGYIVGMLVTLGVMSVFQQPQPALLYLVPGILLSLWGTGLLRGETKQMLEFSEAFTAEQVDDDQHEEKDANGPDRSAWWIPDELQALWQLTMSLWRLLCRFTLDQNSMQNRPASEGSENVDAKRGLPNSGSNKHDEHDEGRKVKPEKPRDDDLLVHFSIRRFQLRHPFANQPGVGGTTDGAGKRTHDP